MRTAKNAIKKFKLKFEIFKGVLNFSRPHDPTENIFEWFLAVRMALPNTFLNGF